MGPHTYCAFAFLMDSLSISDVPVLLGSWLCNSYADNRGRQRKPTGCFRVRTGTMPGWISVCPIVDSIWHLTFLPFFLKRYGKFYPLWWWPIPSKNQNISLQFPVICYRFPFLDHTFFGYLKNTVCLSGFWSIKTSRGQVSINNPCLYTSEND